MVHQVNRHAEIIDAAIARDEAARYPIVASWQRSRVLHELNPNKVLAPERVSQQELNQTQERLGLLLNLSKTKLDQLYLAVGDVGCSVVLADKNGVAIARRGAQQDDKTFNKWGLWTGAIWSEEREGTNGIGTCIIEKRPLTIHKDQHFSSKNTGLSCTAAPIFDHNGNLMAVIDVSSCRADLTASFSQLISVAVVDTARRIETDHFSQSFPDAQIILASTPATLHANNRSPSGAALLAVDHDDLVVGATHSARDAYGLTDADLSSPLPLSTLQGRETDLARDYAFSENRIIQQSLAKCGGNISAAAREMGISRATLHRKIKKIQQNHS